MSETPDDDVVLRLEGVSKVYSGTVAVKQADFDVRRGAVNVLVGVHDPPEPLKVFSANPSALVSKV